MGPKTIWNRLLHLKSFTKMFFVIFTIYGNLKVWKINHEKILIDARKVLDYGSLIFLSKKRRLCVCLLWRNLSFLGQKRTKWSGCHIYRKIVYNDFNLLMTYFSIFSSLDRTEKNIVKILVCASRISVVAISERF